MESPSVVLISLLLRSSCRQSLQVAQGIATERLDRGTESRDVVSFMWNDAQESKSKTTREQVEAIAGVLCIAGTETGATTISGLIYWILSTPCAYERLTAEVRAIKQIENLTPSTLSTLPYLNACIREGLRLHSPVTGPAGRIIPKSGATVDGYWLPEGVLPCPCSLSYNLLIPTPGHCRLPSLGLREH